ncbi:MAG: hypothetical protein IIA33_11230, partial [Planctomycetes bacterium]|nr:hypothetical protein [Planctomycetota bacterium]
MFEEHADEFRPFLLEKPLWVFVGGSVTAVRTQNRRRVSDVLDVLLMLSEFVGNRRQSVDLLDRLMSGEAGLLDTNGQEIFSRSFGYLIQSGRRGDDLFADILRRLFNADSVAAIHVENLKGTDGEIAVRLGDNDPFGVVNVGDASSLCKLCEDHTELVVEEREFSSSLFDGINAQERKDITAFVMQIDSGLAPAVHTSWLLDSTDTPLVASQIAGYLIPQAQLRNVDIAVFGTVDRGGGAQHLRWFWNRGT